MTIKSYQTRIARLERAAAGSDRMPVAMLIRPRDDYAAAMAQLDAYSAAGRTVYVADLTRRRLDGRATREP